MSMRQEWKIDSRYFGKTSTERGGLRHFIDGKPVRREVWHQQVERALKDQADVTRIASTQP